MPVSRFGVSLEENLLTALDQYVKDNRFTNRSQAIRHLIEKNLVERKWLCNNIVAGALIMLYDHHKKELTAKLSDIQHEYYDVFLSAQHFHLSHEACLEIVALKGTANKLTELSDKLISHKAIKHVKLMMSQSE